MFIIIIIIIIIIVFVFVFVHVITGYLVDSQLGDKNGDLWI